MGERQKDLIGSRLFQALTVSKGDVATCTSTLTVFVGGVSRQVIQSFTEGHSNTSSPHNLF